MPSLCNSTLCSCPDQDEFQYWSSFCEKPFISGDRMQIYKGKLNGKGPRAGDYSVVKVFTDKPGTETRCRMEVKKSRTCADWLARFLNQGQYSSQSRVKVAQLVMAPMDQVSLLNKVLAHGKRRINSGEWILLEEMLHERGDITPFVDKLGRMYRERAASGSNLGLSYLASRQGQGPSHTCSLDNRELLEAFVHFTHHVSHGQLVVCGLEGVEDAQGRVLLKVPTIHSQQKEFGETDQGASGMKLVMNRHVCNKHCRRWGRLLRSASSPASSSNLLSSSSSVPSSFGTFPRHRPRTPSAPFEPDVLFHLSPISESRRTSGDSVPTAPPYEDIDMLADEMFQWSQQLAPHCSLQDLRMFVRMEIMAAKEGIPNDPPPPYTAELIKS